MTDQAVDREFAIALPKCELHAHLTGSISRNCLHQIWTTKRSRGLCLDLDDPLVAIQPNGGFVDVVTFFPLFDKYIYLLCDDPASVEFATRDVLVKFEQDGVRYLELRTTPRESLSSDMSKEAYVATVCKTLAAWNEMKGQQMKVFLILSIDRKVTSDQAEAVVDLAIQHQYISLKQDDSRVVVGVDLCGNPARGNPATFSPAFKRAKANGLGVTVHFAEIPASSTDEELDTILSWLPDRLGHGVHIPTRLKQTIKDRKLALELCLSCNILAKLTNGGFQDHHFGEWYRSDCPIALGTDDVGVFESPLSSEYLLAAFHFNLTAVDMVKLSRQAAKAAFVQDGWLDKLLDSFEQSMNSEDTNV